MRKPKLFVKRCVIFFLCIIVCVLTADWFVSHITPLINETTGVVIVDSESWFNDISLLNDDVAVDCVLTIENTTDTPLVFRLEAIMIPEFVIGTISAPILRTEDLNGSEVDYELQPKTSDRFNVRFIANKGWGSLLKMDRELPTIHVKIQH